MSNSTPTKPLTTHHNAIRKISTYKTLLYTFLCFTLVGLLCSFLLSSYLKKQTIQELATTQAEQQADIIFKALWQGMMQGWSKPDMDQFIHSLELGSQDNTQNVLLVRSKIIEDQFGVSDASSQRLANDPVLARAMASGEIITEQEKGQLRYLYPLVATEACLACHINSHAGAIHGVIDIRFNDSLLDASLSQTFNSYITVTLLVILIFCTALFFLIRLQIVQPLRQLSLQIREAIQDDLSVNRINVNQYRLQEPFLLAQSFNQLAQELDDYHHQLKENSYIDALTGLCNRRYFSEKMPNFLKKSHSTEQPLTLMLIDLDRFKAINDTYGHEAGDLALIFFSDILNKHVKKGDLVIRLGGDEFVVVLAQTTVGGAQAIKRRLAEALNENRANLGVVKLHLEASVGYATYPNDANTTDGLLQKADEAMYHEKRARRELHTTELA